jgi:hypothetical protein
MNEQKYFSPSEILVNKFLEIANKFNSNVDLIQVLKARVYKICHANVLVRAASRSFNNRKFFFGINYITVEEMANLDNPYIAFICGNIDNTIILPANILFNNLDKISHDRNGEFKINIDANLNIALQGRGNRLDCSVYTNAWHLLNKPENLDAVQNTVEESIHSVIQGRLLEIGNIRGFETFCPNKSKQFNGVVLSDISTLKICPQLQFSDYDLLRQIDVQWFKKVNNHLIPEYAFEIELSTGTWSGVGRMSTLLNYSNTKLFVISNDEKKYNKVVNTLPLTIERYKHIRTDLIGDLYSAELQLKELRYNIGL